MLINMPDFNIVRINVVSFRLKNMFVHSLFKMNITSIYHNDLFIRGECKLLIVLQIRTFNYYPVSQKWQWRHVLFTKLSGTYNR